MPPADRPTDLTRVPLVNFLRESNAIEGIHRDPTAEEIAAAERFMRLFSVSAIALGDFQAVVAPGKPLREREGMDVRVGDYIAPPGGPNILRRLQMLVRQANRGADPWETHIRFQVLHPYLDGNGRTGRILWAWGEQAMGRNPFIRPFLQSFYYQTLARQK